LTNKKEASINTENKITFSKAQIVSSSRFSFIEKDILKALLEDKKYTLEEAKKILDDFNKKEVR
jgi:hypothetical protein